MERQPIHPKLSQEVRERLLANFVLGLKVKLPEGFGVAEHDDFMDAAPPPESYPQDAP